MPGILEVSELTTHFFTPRGVVKALDRVSLTLEPGETLGIVGESGCGKSVLGFSILNLINPPGRIISGSVRFKGKELLTSSETELERLRGKEISMIFQEALRSLNPVRTIGDQIAEVLQIHEGMKRSAAIEKAVQLLKDVEITAPERRIYNYPHEFSGGMRQRAMIAMGLACSPQVLIADEPSAGLDVTIQAQILDLMRRLRERVATAILLITHDVGIVAQMCRRVMVIYAGRVVEVGPVSRVLRNPLHPYTRGLLQALPEAAGGQRRLGAMPGIAPDPADLPSGCNFHPRCPNVHEPCYLEDPPEIGSNDGRIVRCWLYANKGASS
jgi:peptide/nickel transport system ATP-binding protein/oligopeptide transport system ATP-binding protein